MLDENINVLDKSGNESQTTWRYLLEHTDQFRSIPTDDPFLLGPLVILVTAVNTRSKLLGMTVAQYLQAYELWTKDGGPLRRMANVPLYIDNRGKPYFPTSFKALWEIKHNTSTVPNFSVHCDPTRFEPITRLFVASIIHTNGVPLKTVRSSWLDGINLPIGTSTLTDTINKLADHINLDTKPSWEYTDYNQFKADYEDISIPKYPYTYQILTAPIYDAITGQQLIKPKLTTPKEKPFKPGSISPPYVDISLSIEGSQGSIKSWGLSIILHGKRNPLRLDNEINSLKGIVSNIQKLSGKKATTHNISKLIDNLQKIDLDSLLRGTRYSSEYQKINAAFTCIIEDSKLRYLALGNNAIEIQQQLNITDSDAKLCCEAVQWHKKFGKPGSITPPLSLYLEAASRRKVLNHIFSNHGFDLAMHLIASKHWRVARLGLIDFTSINKQLKQNQAIII